MCNCKKMTPKGFEVGVPASEIRHLMQMYNEVQSLSFPQLAAINKDYKNRIRLYAEDENPNAYGDGLTGDSFKCLVMELNVLSYECVEAIYLMGTYDADKKIGIGVPPPPPCDCSECPEN